MHLEVAASGGLAGARGAVQLPDGTTVRGAKKGGLTDHLSGPHLIPNVGREAMIPREVVRRQRPVPKKPAQPSQQQQQPKAATAKERRSRRSPRRGGRSRSQERDRSRDGRSRTGAEEEPRRRSREGRSADASGCGSWRRRE